MKLKSHFTEKQKNSPTFLVIVSTSFFELLDMHSARQALFPGFNGYVEGIRY